MDEIVVSVNSVYKDFVLPHERVNSVKGMFTGMFSHATSRKESQHALKDISFEIKKGEFFGIVGRNGSGKSTLLKILAGIYQPTKGDVNIKGRLVPFIELGVGFNVELTGRDNVYLNGAMLGFSVKEIDAMYDEIVEFAELERFMDQKLKNYSSGMQVRLAFSMATRAKADILLVDEVLAVGDADFQRKCFDYFRQLKKEKKTVILVTHDMNAIREYCDRALMIEQSHMIEQGSAQKVATKYTRLFVEQSSDNARQSKGDRWGNGAITYESISVSEKRLKDNDSLTIKLTAIATQKIEHPIFGFLIKNASFNQILGSNSQIKHQVIEVLEPGQRITIEWIIPNVFNDGRYYIDPAIVYKGGNQVADWWEEAAEFTVLKEEKTPYLVNPELSFGYSIGHK
jgi:ABC-2 type transport system ATP-binding protein